MSTVVYNSTNQYTSSLCRQVSSSLLVQLCKTVVTSTPVPSMVRLSTPCQYSCVQHYSTNQYTSSLCSQVSNSLPVQLCTTVITSTPVPSEVRLVAPCQIQLCTTVLTSTPVPSVVWLVNPRYNTMNCDFEYHTVRPVE